MQAELNKYFYNDITNIIMDYFHEDYKAIFTGIMYEICDMMDAFSMPFLNANPDVVDVEEIEAWRGFASAYMFNYKLVNDLFPEYNTSDDEAGSDFDFDHWQ
jgi:hypothetical protein